MARKSRHDYRAMLDEFGMNYGVDETKLDGWKRLCNDCGVQQGPSITKCKRNIKRANINILDLIYAKKEDKIPYHHLGRHALAAYTREEGMWFPKELAKENGFLKVLLVDIF
ncbi:hypothetical protein Q7P37_009373 [Cladosporium fusiforme]